MQTKSSQEMPASHEGHERGSPAYRRLTLAMLFAGFSTFSLLYSVQPLLPLFAVDYHLSAEASSLAVSLATGSLAFGILAAGVISDRVGRRPLMVFGTMASALLTIAAALAPNWPALLILRLFTGLALAGVPAVAMAYVSEEVHPSSVGAAMGLYIGGTALGGMGGRLLASLLTFFFTDWRWAVGIVGVAGLAMAEAFRRLAPPSRRFVRRPPGHGAAGQLFRDKALPLLFVESFLLMGIFVTVYNYVGFRLMEPPYGLNQAAVGAIFLLYLLGSASSTWFGSLAGRVGRRHIFWVTVLILIAGVGITAARSLPLVILGIGIVTVGFFGAHSIASAWVGRRALANRGQASALYLFFYYLGSSIVGSLGGVAWTHAAWPGVVGFCLVLGLVALACSLALQRVAPLPTPEARTIVPLQA
jgi:YNFM family putative membrane transporter